MAGPQRVPIGGKTNEFPGGSFNALVDDYYRRRGEGGTNSPRDPSSAPVLAVTVKNSSGAAREPGHVLGITGPIFNYTDNANVVYQGPTFDGDVPDVADHTRCWVVLQDFIADGAVGGSAGILVGPCWVKVDVTDEAHTHAKLKDADAAKLESATSGEPILWKETGTGTKWAFISKSAGGGSTSNVVAFAVVVTEAAAATHGSGGITAGAVGTCELLNIDGTSSGGAALQFKSRHRVPCAVDTIIALDSPHTIEAGRTWPADPDAPESGEAAVWGQLVDPVDYLAELTGFAATKALFTDGAAATDIQWGGDEC